MCICISVPGATPALGLLSYARGQEGRSPAVSYWGQALLRVLDSVRLKGGYTPLRTPSHSAGHSLLTSWASAQSYIWLLRKNVNSISLHISH